MIYKRVCVCVLYCFPLLLAGDCSSQTWFSCVRVWAEPLVGVVLSLQGLEGGSLPLHLISHLRLVEGQWFLKTNLCFTDICCNEVSHLACYFLFPFLGQLCSIRQCCHFWSPSDGEYLCVSPKCRNLWSSNHHANYVCLLLLSSDGEAWAEIGKRAA